MASDIPRWAVDAATETVKETMATASPLFIERIARALIQAEARGAERMKERAALVAKEIGESYGEDETGWFECCETVESSIRNLEAKDAG